MNFKAFRVVMIVAMLVAFFVPVSGVWADDANPTPQEQWTEFLHYINIAKPKVAVSYGQSLMDSGIAPKDVYMLSMETEHSLQTLRKGRNLEGLDGLCKKYLAMIEKGYLDWRSNPQQIEASIAMMGKSLEGYRLGKSRLKESGEYAVPLLVQKLLDEKTSPLIRRRIITMLEEMGRDAVRPFSVALQTKDLKILSALANALGRIEYPSALPRLCQALHRKDVIADKDVHRIVREAVLSCSSNDASYLTKPLSEVFFIWAQNYYNHADSILPDSRYPDAAHVWFWKEGTGVQDVKVPAVLLPDIYAMRFARISLENDPKYFPAVPLWLSAIARREMERPASGDPLWPDDQPKAAYYLLASSPRYLQTALEMAMNDNNAELAKVFIKTLSQTTGVKSLVKPLTGGAQPLVAAMGYPDREVRFLAAETLALAMPQEKFVGDQIVLLLLNNALRQEGVKVCLLVCKNDSQRNKLKSIARDAGYDVTDIRSERDVLTQAARSPVGMDLVIAGPDVNAAAITRSLRRQGLYYYVPVLACQSSDALRQMAALDKKMLLLPANKMNDDGVKKAIREAEGLASGKALNPEQAKAWSIRAAGAIRKLGLSGGTIFDLKRCVSSLATALTRKDPDVQIAACKALSVIQVPVAQQVILKLALDSKTDMKVRVAALKAATDSIRRFGNECSEDQCGELIKQTLAATDQALREASAETLGAMNLPSEKTPKLIISTDQLD